MYSSDLPTFKNNSIVLYSLSSQEVEVEAPKKAKKARDKDGDSSDDFRPSSKKRKFDKLLSTRISSSDEDKGKKKKEPESNTK